MKGPLMLDSTERVSSHFELMQKIADSKKGRKYRRGIQKRGLAARKAKPKRIIIP